MKDFVIEALRSIAELITYGDQHDVAYFEYVSAKGFLFQCILLFQPEADHTSFLLVMYFLTSVSAFLQVFHGEAGDGGICTYIKNQQNCYCVASVAADNEYCDPKLKK